MYSTVAAPCASSLLLVKVTNTGDSLTLCKALCVSREYTMHTKDWRSILTGL